MATKRRQQRRAPPMLLTLAFWLNHVRIFLIKRNVLGLRNVTSFPHHPLTHPRHYESLNSPPLTPENADAIAPNAQSESRSSEHTAVRTNERKRSAPPGRRRETRNPDATKLSSSIVKRRRAPFEG